MMSVKMVLFVERIIVQLHLVLTQNLIVVINQLQEMIIFAHLYVRVQKMKEIVMLMMNVKMVIFVDQTIVQPHLVLPLKSIVAINQLLEMNIFVHLEFLVEKMKEIVILTMNAKSTTFVDQIIVQHHLVLTLKLIAVMKQLQEMKIIVHLEILVEKVKEIVIPMKNAKKVQSVIQPNVHPSL